MRASSLPARRAIIVTGTPGTGKTTFAKRLAQEIGATYIPITEFVSNHKLYTSLDRGRGSKVVNLARLQKSLRHILSQARHLVVVDTHISDGIIAENLVKFVFVLRCNPGILEKRLRRKEWNQRKVRENVLAEMLDACLIDAVKWYGLRRLAQLDTSHTSAGKCVDTAKRILHHGVRRRLKIDWITTLGKENSLPRYLEW